MRNILQYSILHGFNGICRNKTLKLLENPADENDLCKYFRGRKSHIKETGTEI